ncbi:MAG: TraB/GumN family protein [Betaproteobacteria bacterium]|nr:TraB/GumN family protein [Betaproteobacteria bacterium]
MTGCSCPCAAGVFVAVGALHLYGEQGLLALLREDGYRLTRVL